MKAAIAKRLREAETYTASEIQNLMDLPLKKKLQLCDNFQVYTDLPYVGYEKEAEQKFQRSDAHEDSRRFVNADGGAQ